MNRKSKRARAGGFSLLCVMMASSVAMAQQEPLAEQGDVADAAKQVEADAAQAEARGDLGAALRLYEQAYRLNQDGYYIYQRVRLYEEMGDEVQAMQLLEEERETIAASARVNDLPMYEGMLKRKIEEKEGESSSVGVTEVVDPVAVDPVVEEPERRIAPQLMLAGGGVSAITGGVLLALGRRQAIRLRCTPSSPYTQSDERCDQGTREELDFELNREEWESRVRASLLKQRVGVGLLGAGAGLIGAGLVWAITSSKAGDEEGSTLMLLPEVGTEQATMNVSLIF